MKIGIDVGSTGIKIVFVQQTDMVWKKVVPTKPGQAALVQGLIEQGMAACGIGPRDIDQKSVTGYGRNLIASTDEVVDEISANAAGIHQLSGGSARTLINIGGQDVKVIRLDNQSRGIDFKMNDKCAAGTGRFFEMAANILDTPLSGFHVPEQIEPRRINSTCAVFAESEIVSLMATDSRAPMPSASPRESSMSRAQTDNG
jgi:predicted CoA-substrate-specific enzyme activase